jgi:hypothetical protein
VRDLPVVATTFVGCDALKYRQLCVTVNSDRQQFCIKLSENMQNRKFPSRIALQLGRNNYAMDAVAIESAHHAYASTTRIHRCFRTSCNRQAVRGCFAHLPRGGSLNESQGNERSIRHLQGEFCESDGLTATGSGIDLPLNNRRDARASAGSIQRIASICNQENSRDRAAED